MDYKEKVIMDASDFVLLSDYVPGIVQEIRYFSTFNFVGEQIDGYEEPIALMRSSTLCSGASKTWTCA